jgi:hypothetical protein
LRYDRIVVGTAVLSENSIRPDSHNEAESGHHLIRCLPPEERVGPLLWFGLLEHRGEEIPGRRFGQHHFYRKAELFQRLLAFNVQVDRSEGARH